MKSYFYAGIAAIVDEQNGSHSDVDLRTCNKEDPDDLGTSVGLFFGAPMLEMIVLNHSFYTSSP